MITPKQAKEIYDKENEWRNDEAAHVKDAGDFYVIEPKRKACLGICMITKDGVMTGDLSKDGTLEKIMKAKVVL